MGAWLVSKVRVFLFPHCKENLKGEKDFENIHENYVPNVKDHVLSTFVTKDNQVRVVPTSKHFFASEFNSEEEKKALEET